MPLHQKILIVYLTLGVMGTIGFMIAMRLKANKK